MNELVLTILGLIAFLSYGVLGLFIFIVLVIL